MQSNDRRSFFKRRNFCLNLQQLCLELRNPLSCIVFVDDVPYYKINIPLPLVFDSRFRLVSSLVRVAVALVAKRRRSSLYLRA